MRRLLRFLGFVLLASAMLIVAGYAVLSSVVSPARLSATLARSVERATGRALTIAGPTHLHFGLVPSFSAENVSLANPPGFSRPDMARAVRLTAELALLPLLGGDAVIERITVMEPDVLLERRADGTPNWVFAPGEKRALYAPAGSAGEGGGGGGRVEVRTLRLEGGQIAWRTAPGKAGTIQIGQLAASEEDEDAPLKLASRFKAGERDYTLQASGGSLARLRGGPVSGLLGPWPVSATLKGEGTNVSVTGGIAHLEDGRGVDLRVEGSLPDLAALATVCPEWAVPHAEAVTFSGRITDVPNNQFHTEQLRAHASNVDLGAYVRGAALSEASLDAPGPGQTAKLDLAGVAEGGPIRGTVTALQPDVLRAERPIAVTARAEAAGATLDAHGTVPPPGSGELHGLDLFLSVHAPDLSAFNGPGRALPPMRDLAASAHLEDAGFRLQGVTARDLNATGSFGDLSGTVTATWSPRLSLNGQLGSKSLDGDAVVGVLGALAGKADQTPGAPPAPGVVAPTPGLSTPGNAASAPATPSPLFGDEPLPLDRLREADSDLTLDFGRMSEGGQTFRDLHAHILLTNGRLTVSPFRMAAPAGLVVGGFSADASAEPPPVALSLRAPAFSAASLATLLGEDGGAEGSVQADALLAGYGRTPRALASTLRGHLGLAMVNGSVGNGLLAGVFGSALSAAGIDPSPDDGGETSVRCFAIRAEFSRGIGTFSALALDTSHLSLDGTGRIDLGTEQIDLHLRPHLWLGSAGASSFVSLRGPLRAPAAALEPAMGGRYGITIGGGGILRGGGSGCTSALALARGGMPGPLPGNAADLLGGGERPPPATPALPPPTPLLPSGVLAAPSPPAPGAQKPTDLLGGLPR